MEDVRFAEVMRRERERLTREREEILDQQKELTSKLNEISRELAAIDAYGAAKPVKRRRLADNPVVHEGA